MEKIQDNFCMTAPKGGGGGFDPKGWGEGV